jgi:hypothetical protein
MHIKIDCSVKFTGPKLLGEGALKQKWPETSQMCHDKFNSGKFNVIAKALYFLSSPAPVPLCHMPLPMWLRPGSVGGAKCPSGTVGMSPAATQSWHSVSLDTVVGPLSCASQLSLASFPF